MRIKIIIIFLLSLPLLFLSCGNDLSFDNKIKFDKEFNIISDTIVKDLPKLKPVEQSAAYSSSDLKNKRAGFSSMENGADSIKIRVWYLYQVGHTEHVVEIENINKKWVFSQYILTFKYDQIHDSVIFVGKTVQHKNPNSGNERFIQKLFELEILTLPSSESISDYSGANAIDAGRVDVEIASENKFRFYSYDDPFRHYSNRNAKKMEDIMTLIEKEFNFKRVEIL